MLYIDKIIEEIKKEATWVDYSQTRDVILTGDNKEVNKIGVCWVATKEALEEAKKQDIHFIIDHENFLYLEHTHMWQGYFQARQDKIKFCKENDITVYRLHDGWDMFPKFGVADSLNHLTGLPFEERVINSYHTKAYINETLTVREIAQKYANALAGYGSNHVEILGDPDYKVKVFATGVGAATHLPEMIKMGADCVMLADDGGTNWIEHQWCLDHHIPIILLHHSVNEMPGMDGMVEYLRNKFPNLEVYRLHEGFKYTLVQQESN